MSAYLPRIDLSYVQMVILTDDRQKAPLTQTEASEIEKHIFDHIYASGGERPRFKGRYLFSVDDGAIIINTHVDSVNWLKKVVRSYKPKALRITDIKNSPQYTAKVKVDVTKLDSKAVHNLLDLLEAHNVGLQTDGWRIMSTGNEYEECNSYPSQVSSVTFLIDDPGRKMLREKGYKLFVGFSTLTFQFIGRVKRNLTTGRICKDKV